LPTLTNEARARGVAAMQRPEIRQKAAETRRQRDEQRRQEVLTLYGLGAFPDRIADHLGISRARVDRYLQDAPASYRIETVTVRVRA